MIAVDINTGRVLTPEEAEIAADNPRIYTWVETRFTDEISKKHTVDALALR
jgi:hypothetical protein